MADEIEKFEAKLKEKEQELENIRAGYEKKIENLTASAEQKSESTQVEAEPDLKSEQQYLTECQKQIDEVAKQLRKAERFILNKLVYSRIDEEE